VGQPESTTPFTGTRAGSFTVFSTCSFGALDGGLSVLAKVFSCAVVGLDGVLIEVEVDVSNGGQPGMILVGLPDAAVQESRSESVPRSATPAASFRMAGSLSIWPRPI
jgi:hypothetical protein